MNSVTQMSGMTATSTMSNRMGDQMKPQQATDVRSESYSGQRSEGYSGTRSESYSGTRSEGYCGRTTDIPAQARDTGEGSSYGSDTDGHGGTRGSDSGQYAIRNNENVQAAKVSDAQAFATNVYEEPEAWDARASKLAVA